MADQRGHSFLPATLTRTPAGSRDGHVDTDGERVDAPPPPPPPPPRSPATVALPRRREVRRPKELGSVDYATLAGCSVSGLALTWVVFARLTEGAGWFGFLLVAYGTSVALYGLVTADRLGLLVAKDRVATVLVTTGSVALAAPLLWLIGYIVLKGIPGLTGHFFVEDQRAIRPEDPSTAGGGGHAIMGTLQQVGLALAMTLPLALATAIFLNETRSRLRRPVRIFVDAMSGLPSIVAGLFIYAVLIIPYAERTTLFGFNGFMASLALSMVMLPTVTRTIEVVLRLIPSGLREAGLALGASRARTVWSVVLPTARTGVTTAVVLGVARTVGETAPLLLTAFGYELFNRNPFSEPQESLPLFVFRYIRLPDQNVRERGFTGALVLLVVVLLLFSLARFAGRDRSRRRDRRRAAAEPAMARPQEVPTP
jgi:phosphate transport system permease protein